MLTSSCEDDDDESEVEESDDDDESRDDDEADDDEVLRFLFLRVPTARLAFSKSASSSSMDESFE